MLAAQPSILTLFDHLGDVSISSIAATAIDTNHEMRPHFRSTLTLPHCSSPLTENIHIASHLVEWKMVM